MRLECFSTYFQKKYTNLRLEDIFQLKQSFSINFVYKTYEKLGNTRHYDRCFTYWRFDVLLEGLTFIAEKLRL